MKRIVFLSIAVMMFSGMMAFAEPQYEMDIFARLGNGTSEMSVTRGDQVQIDATFTNLGDPVTARLFLEIFDPDGTRVRSKQVVRPFTVDRPVLVTPQQSLGSDGARLGVYSIVFHAEAADQPGSSISNSQTLYVTVRAAGSPFVGFMGFASIEDLNIVTNLGAKDVAWGTSVHPSLLESLVEDVISQGVGMATRAPGYASLQDEETHQLNFAAIRNHLEATFLGNDVSGVTEFHYLIDEFCHPDKWDISAQDLADLHAMAKSIDPRIKIFHNSAHLNCFKARMEESAPDYPVLMDYVGFTVTPAKLLSPGYLDLIDSIAGEINDIYGSQTQVIALYAACDNQEYWNMPTAQELVDGATMVLAMENIHGIGFYPWRASSWSSVAVRDVCEDPAYIDAFNLVFAMARERFGVTE